MHTPNKPNMFQTWGIRKAIPFFYRGLQTLPPVGRNSAEVNRNMPQQRGSLTEMFVYHMLSQVYSADQIQFDLKKAESQTHNGRDGIADPGIDLQVNVDGAEFRIDVKLDSAVTRDGKVSLELFNKWGHKGFALNPIANNSVHIDVAPQKYVFGNKLILTAVWVDLELLRCSLSETDGKYKLGCITEELSPYGNRLLKVPIAYLERLGIARTDRFTDRFV